MTDFKKLAENEIAAGLQSCRALQDGLLRMASLSANMFFPDS
jgi:hypothetical protein